MTRHALSPCYEELANLPFPDNYPTAETTAALRDELLFQRATQVYLWALPAVSMMAMKEASEQAFGAGYHVLPVWKERLDAKTIVTTPNSDVIYAMGYVDVGSDGPLVIEIPPRQQGILDDFWQRPIPGPRVDGHAYAGDVGLAGPDGGKGGKFSSCCRPVTAARYRTVTSSIARARTTSSSSGAPFTMIRRISPLPST